MSTNYLELKSVFCIRLLGNRDRLPYYDAPKKLACLCRRFVRAGVVGVPIVGRS